MRQLSIIRFADKTDTILLERKLISLPLRDEAIISKSIEFFNDPEPCMIHRSAVMKRLFAEIESYFEDMIQKDVLEINMLNIPSCLKEYLSLPAGAAKVTLLLKNTDEIRKG